MSVQWVKDLPEAPDVFAGRRKYDWQAIANDLRANPAEWALVARDIPRAHAYQIKSGQKRAFRPPDHFLVRTVGPRGPRADLYMAYIGTPGARVVAEANSPWSERTGTIHRG